MELTNEEWVGRALRLLRDGLWPFFESVMRQVHPDDWKQQIQQESGQTALQLRNADAKIWDVNVALKVMTNHWSAFKHTAIGDFRPHLHHLLDKRRIWAHQQELEVIDVTDTFTEAKHVLNALTARTDEEVEQPWQHEARSALEKLTQLQKDFLGEDLPTIDFSRIVERKLCDFCGREWVFDELVAWVNTEATSNQPMRILVADHGFGKSAIAASLVKKEPRLRIAAYHFCQADDPTTLSPSAFVRSMAAQFRERFEGYKEQVSKPNVRDILRESACKDDPRSSWIHGVLMPLREVKPADPDEKHVVVIDALNEAVTSRDGGITIVDLLAIAVRRNLWPPWLRVVATSREDPTVLKSLGTVKLHRIHVQHRKNRRDLRTYVGNRLKQLATGAESVDQQCALLEEMADGNFQYAVAALDELEELGLPYHGRLPVGLNSLYLEFFKRRFPDPASYGTARHVLEVVLAAREALGRPEIGEILKSVTDAELARVLAGLRHYLDETGGRYRFRHQSVAEWLIDPDNVFFASPTDGHKQLAEWCLAKYEHDPRNLPAYVAGHISHHLIETQRWEDLEKVLLDLEFLEGLAETGRLGVLLDHYTTAIAKMPDRPGSRWRLLPLIHEAIREDEGFLRRHPSALFQCLWNRGWWYDCPQAAEHYELSAEEERNAPWNQPGPKLHELLEEWWLRKEEATPGFRWLKSLRPPPHPLGQPLIAKFEAHAIAFSPDSQKIATATANGTLSVWNTETGQKEEDLCRYPEGIQCLAFSPKGNQIAVALRDDDDTVLLWDLSQRRKVCRFAGGEGHGVVSLIFVKGTLTEEGLGLFCQFNDYRCCLWNVETKEPKNLPFEGQYSHVGKSLSLSLCAVTRDLRYLLYEVDDEGELFVFDLDDASERKVRHLEWPAEFGDFYVGGCFSEDGKYVLGWTCDGIGLWNIEEPEKPTVFKTSNLPLDATLSSDNRFVAVADGTMVRIFDIENETEVACLKGYSYVDGFASNVSEVALSPDGRFVAACSDDGTVRLWRNEKYSERYKLRDAAPGDVSAAQFSSDGNCFAFVNETEDTSDMAIKALIADLMGETFAGTFVKLISSPFKEGIRRPCSIWDLSSHLRIHLLSQFNPWSYYDRESPGDLDEIVRKMGEPDPVEVVVLKIVFGASGRAIVVEASNHRLRIFDAIDERELENIPTTAVNVRHLDATEDARRVAILTEEGTIHLLDSNERREINRRPADDLPIRALTFLDDGSRLAGVDEERTVRVWDTKTGSEQTRFTQPPETEFIEVAPDGRSMVAWSAKGNAFLLKPGEAEPLPLDAHEGPIDDVSFSPDGSRLVTSARGAPPCIWEVATGRLSPESERIGGIGDVRAIAAGPKAFPWRAVYGGPASYPETVVESASTGEPAAWFPVPLDVIVTHPSGEIWVGQQSPESRGDDFLPHSTPSPLYFFKLEGG